MGRLFAKEEEVVEEEQKTKVEKTQPEFVIPAYFNNVPTPFLIIFSWLTYKAVSSILILLESTYFFRDLDYLQALRGAGLLWVTIFSVVYP